MKLTKEQHTAECVRRDTADLKRCQSELRGLEEDCRTLGHPRDWPPEDMGFDFPVKYYFARKSHYEMVIAQRKRPCRRAGKL